MPIVSLSLAYRSIWRQVVFMTSNVAGLVKRKASVSCVGRFQGYYEMITETKLIRKIEVTERGERRVEERKNGH
jgi:hypothetical protein